MAYVIKRGSKWWIRYKEAGKWQSSPTEFLVADATGKRNAKRLADSKQRRVDAAAVPGAAGAGPLTVKRYLREIWLPQREVEGQDWQADRGRLDKHVIPKIGDLVLADVRAPVIADLVHGLRFPDDIANKLAPRTVLNIYSVIKAAFRDAEIKGLIDSSPCKLTKRELGKKVDKDPTWRRGAWFEREEAEAMISDERIPLDRRMTYALGLLAGLRPGEAAALRWHHYDANVKPLGSLEVAVSYNTKRSKVKSTKTETVKTIPVHATLAAMLAEWKLSGWENMMGRAPEPGDLIIPLPPADASARTKREGEAYRGTTYSARRWRDVDIKTLGWRYRQFYNTRASFITLIRRDGADKAVINDRVTHVRPQTNAADGYDRYAGWDETCAEVAKLRIQRRARVTGRVTVGHFPTKIAAPEEGIEPPTRRLTAACSTTELLRKEWMQ